MIFFGGRSALLTLATTTFCNTIFDPFWWTTALEGSGSRPQSCCTVAQYTQDCNVVNYVIVEVDHQQNLSSSRDPTSN